MKSKIDIEKIRKQLPHGAQTEIALKANVSLQTVHYVLRGKSCNIKVLNAIADYLTTYQATENRLSALVSA